MKVRVLYFASLREQLGLGQEEFDLPAGVQNLGALRTHLAGRAPTWQAALAGRATLRMAVNQDMADATTPVKGGDEVAFFPPVTGG